MMKYFPGNRLLISMLLICLFSIGMAAASPEKDMGLVEVQLLDPSITKDMRYATTDNFTGQILYPSDRCVLRQPVAYRLIQAQRQLRAQGLGLKVFDCYRPLSVQRKMWAVYPDANYVANPATGGSRHNRGASVDVGLVDASGRELLMPSAFDEFSERSHLDFMAATPEALRNRQTLQAVMRQVGFSSVTTEWWHFDAPEWRDYEVSNMDPRFTISGSAQVLVVAQPRPGSVETVLWALQQMPQGWRTILGPIAVNVGRVRMPGSMNRRRRDTTNG